MTIKKSKTTTEELQRDSKCQPATETMAKRFKKTTKRTKTIQTTHKRKMKKLGMTTETRYHRGAVGINPSHTLYLYTYIPPLSITNPKCEHMNTEECPYFSPS